MSEPVGFQVLFVSSQRDSQPAMPVDLKALHTDPVLPAEQYVGGRIILGERQQQPLVTYIAAVISGDLLDIETRLAGLDHRRILPQHDLPLPVEIELIEIFPCRVAPPARADRRPDQAKTEAQRPLTDIDEKDQR